MQLCTNARLFLDMVAASGQPKLWELTPVEARKKVVELTRLVECEEAIGKIEDRELPGPGGPLPYRVYTPVAAKDRPSGGIIFFHGGAWVLGDLDTHDCLCRILANESGCRVASIDYRLAPEHPFPAAVEDACAATTWIAAHTAELNIDPTRLGIAGDSAGGSLGGSRVSSDEGGRFQDSASSAVVPCDRYCRRQSIAPGICRRIFPGRSSNELGGRALLAVRH